MSGVLTNICLLAGLSYLGGLETLVMLKRYAYHESSGFYMVVRPCNLRKGGGRGWFHPRALQRPAHFSMAYDYDKLREQVHLVWIWISLYLGTVCNLELF